MALAVLRSGRLELLAVLALLITTAIWGSTFFLIKDLVGRLPPMDLLSLRFAVATIALALCAGRRLRFDRTIVRHGVLLGALYAGGQMLQTVGLAHTAASVSGFITGLYVVLTPLLAATVLRTPIPRSTWVAVVLATLGLGLLSLRGFTVGYGELLTLASAALYAGHIVALGRVSDPSRAWSLAVLQTGVISLLCGIAAAPGGLTLPTAGVDWWSLVYLALVGGALTMLLQTWAQGRLDPTRAAVIMAMEPVWAALFAVTLGGESITVRMVLGGLVILAAMYVVELSPRSPGAATHQAWKESIP